MSKSTKKNTNVNLLNIFSPIAHKKNIILGNSPFNINNKLLSFKNNFEKNNKDIKKEYSSKKNKNKIKANEILINNYLSQRTRLNTEENNNNIKKLKFSSNFIKNKKDNIFKSKNSRSNSKNINFIRKNFENNNNFRTAKKIQTTKNSEHINRKNKSKGHFTKLIGNSNKKIFDENSTNNEYNVTNIHNHSNTKINLKQRNKRFSNSTHKLKSYSSKYRGRKELEDMKRRNINNKIIKQNQIETKISGAIRKISPFSNNKINNTQNNLKNYKNKNRLISNKENQYNKEKEILITEQKEIKNKENNNNFIMKENSSYLVISKKPAQITNFIEKKENNKYINNYFNICQSKIGEINNETNNEFISFEEIHFFFVKQIQTGNKLNAFINCHES